MDKLTETKVNFYAVRIKAGKTALEDVPEKYRALVAERLGAVGDAEGGE